MPQEGDTRNVAGTNDVDLSERVDALSIEVAEMRAIMGHLKGLLVLMSAGVATWSHALDRLVKKL